MAQIDEAPVPEERGWISTFWEQGMEEPPWLVFQGRSPDGDERWDRGLMRRLDGGDRLTIIGDDGEVLWSGALRWRRLGLFGIVGPRTLAPAGIDEALWRSWFVRKPPLVARWRRP